MSIFRWCRRKKADDVRNGDTDASAPAGGGPAGDAGDGAQENHGSTADDASDDAGDVSDGPDFDIDV